MLEPVPIYITLQIRLLMRILLTLCCLVLSVSTMLGQNLIVSPEKPSPGDVITFTYDKDGTPLAKEKNIVIEQKDIFELSDDLSFDVILFSRSLHHIFPVNKIVEKSKKLLKPIVLSTVNPSAYL